MIHQRHPKPIFFDPTQRRRLWFKYTNVCLGFAILVVFVMLLITIQHNPVLPAAKLPDNNFTIKPQQVNISSAAAVPTALPIVLKNTQSNHRSELVGFYSSEDENSFLSLQANISALDTLIPQWLHLDAANGDIQPDDSPAHDMTVDYIHNNRPGLKIIPSIDNWAPETGRWDQGRLITLLLDSQARTNSIEQVKTYVQTNHFAGIAVDFRLVPPAMQALLQLYMQELYLKMHALGLEVTQIVPLADSNFNYPALSQASDYLILTAYNEHGDLATSASIASQGWVQAGLQQRFNELSPAKVIVALGAFGSDFTQRVGSPTNVLISYYTAMRTALTNYATISTDPATFNSTYRYTDKDGIPHTVWFLDGVTLYNDLAIASNYQPKGYALWRLGTEELNVWDVLRSRDHLTASTVDSLRSVKFGYGLENDVVFHGEGEMFRVYQANSQAQRDITVSNLAITRSTYTELTPPYRVERWGGGSNRQVVLTFDDGPDPTYTPQVLDILKKYKVPGTFYEIGMSANLHPDLVQRILDEGHEIGSHTYTHPDIGAIGDGQTRIELNATERLFESMTGRRMILFRAPFAIDLTPENWDQIKPLAVPTQLGYYISTMEITPYDWEGLNADQILAETMRQLQNTHGKVILLHDAGGDRSQTVLALPRIIEKLRAQGYTFVSTATLLGLTTEQIMPHLAPEQSRAAAVSGFGFTLIRWFNNVITFLFMAGIVLGFSRMTILGILATIHTRRSRKKRFPQDYQPTVDVLVPAYNEEKVIVSTINSILKSNYPNFNIIVVDDGSKDQTSERVREAFIDNERVILYTIPNAGKASALNYGILQSSAEIIVAIDADTLLDPQAISLLVRHFSDEKVGAVAGNAKVGNRKTLMAKWQALEYITSQNLDRRAFALLNCITVVPGAIGAWRRSQVIEAGGYSLETLAEDADLTFSIVRHGYKVTYEENAIAWTEAPEEIQAFLKQRFRWTFGTLQVTFKHFSVLFSKHPSNLGLVALPNVLIFGIFFPLVSPVMDLLMVLSLAQASYAALFHTIEWTSIITGRLVVFYLAFFIFEMVAAQLAFSFERREKRSLTVWMFPQRFLYRQLMYYVVIRSFTSAVRGTIVNWNKLERRGLSSQLGTAAPRPAMGASAPVAVSNVLKSES